MPLHIHIARDTQTTRIVRPRRVCFEKDLRILQEFKKLFVIYSLARREQRGR